MKSSNSNRPKKANNLSLNFDLLTEAKRLNINLSATMEQSLALKVSKLKKQEWLEQTKKLLMHAMHLQKPTDFFLTLTGGFNGLI